MVAVAACCFMMTAPVKAEAAIQPSIGTVCACHEFEKKISSREVLCDVDSHIISYLMDVDDDGEDELVVDSCTIRIYQYYYTLQCSNCSATLPNQYGGKVQRHEEAMCNIG